MAVLQKHNMAINTRIQPIGRIVKLTRIRKVPHRTNGTIRPVAAIFPIGA